MNRQQVGIGEIAVVVREFLRAHRFGAAFADVPQTRLLRDAAAGFEHADLALDFVFERALQIAEGVQILDFGLGAEVLGAAPAHADVGVAAQRALFHIAIADFGVLEHLLQRVQIGISFGRRAQVGLGDDFRQRHAAAVVVDIAVAIGIGKAFVHVFGGVFFQMQPGDADSFGARRRARFRASRRGQRQFVHGNLIALGQIGIEIVFARKARMLLDLQIERQRSAQRQLQGAAVEHRQRARQAEAHRASVGVRRIAEARGAAAKDLGRGLQLRVDFEPDHGLVSRGNLARDAASLWESLEPWRFRDYSIRIPGDFARRDPWRGQGGTCLRGARQAPLSPVCYSPPRRNRMPT